MKTPRFSIIVGMFNQLETLPKLIEALNNQTFTDFEVEFCDDGSDDGTREYMRGQAYSDCSFRYRYHRQFNRGMRLAKNLNQGINVARGEYCLFIMADSFPEVNYLEVMDMWAGEGRVLCGVRYQIHNGQGVDVDWRLKKNMIPPENVLLTAEPWRMLTGNGLAVPTEALRKHGGWPERIKGYGGDDYELVARLYYRGYTCWSIVDARLYHHWHKNQEDNPVNEKIVHDRIKKYSYGTVYSGR